MNLIALHGFLGSAQDFKPLVEHFQPRWKLVPDLFEGDKNFLSTDFDGFTEQIFEWVDQAKLTEPIDLVGYSLGGRLALHLVIERPELFRKVILLSTHPGIYDPEKAQERRRQEDEWVKKIVDGPWEKFISEWMAQAIFKGDSERILKEKNFDEKTLIKALTAFSSTRHHYAEKDLLELSHPLTWVCGGNDQKYCGLMEEIHQKRTQKDRLVILPGKGHRLIADKDLSWLYSLFS